MQEPRPLRAHPLGEAGGAAEQREDASSKELLNGPLVAHLKAGIVVSDADAHELRQLPIGEGRRALCVRGRGHGQRCSMAMARAGMAWVALASALVGLAFQVLALGTVACGLWHLPSQKLPA